MDVCTYATAKRRTHVKAAEKSIIRTGHHIYVKEEKKNVPDFALQSKNLRAEFGFDVDALSPGTLAGLAVT